MNDTHANLTNVKMHYYTKSQTSTPGQCNNSKDMKRRQRSGLHNGGHWFSLLPTQFTKTWISRKNNTQHDKQKNKVKLWAMKMINFWTMRSEKKSRKKGKLGAWENTGML